LSAEEEKGARGVPGAEGARGAPGVEGTPGAEGARGAKGARGAEGATGTAGRQGVSGAEGQQGARGVPGTPGPPVSMRRWNRFRRAIITALVVLSLGNGLLGYYVLEVGRTQRDLLRATCVDTRGDASYREVLRDLVEINNATTLTPQQRRARTSQVIDDALKQAGPIPQCPREGSEK
jgi:hypothetical protein